MKLQGEVNITYTTKVCFFYIIDSGITILLYIFFLKNVGWECIIYCATKLNPTLVVYIFFLEKNKKIYNQNGVVISLCKKNLKKKKNDGGCFKFKL